MEDYSIEKVLLNNKICQCCSCEKTFYYGDIGFNRTCPHCSSGNWVFGYIDDNDKEGELDS
jgi:hypothetical protein